jgi:hypothetical protein
MSNGPATAGGTVMAYVHRRTILWIFLTSSFRSMLLPK